MSLDHSYTPKVRVHMTKALGAIRDVSGPWLHAKGAQVHDQSPAPPEGGATATAAHHQLVHLWYQAFSMHMREVLLAFSTYLGL